ncbi:hypothetical protein K3152_09645 [Qipengyuania sp. 1NDH17]|uniref:Uncharacterized protein n=1 Tax=Qipengyuania polymorpha TaxID=2867234 RepID=A0ABS7IY79_9SPHN|nr:hypothetical protein [Qipengyuania polymorpha]MBX7458509.1 hypothetical protein [Qipengyuania polymorpha]
MQLQTAHCEWPVDTEDQLRACLEALDENDEFAILSTGPQRYMQTAVQAEGFVIEKREGSEDTHFHARLAGEGSDGPRAVDCDEKRGWLARLFPIRSRPPAAHHVFAREEMVEVLVAYYLQQPSPAFVRWAEGY